MAGRGRRAGPGGRGARHEGATGRVGGAKNSRIAKRASTTTANQNTTMPVGWSQKAKITAAPSSTMMPIHRFQRRTNASTGPAWKPAESAACRTAATPWPQTERIVTATREGPIMRAPMATTRASTPTTRTVVRRYVTRAS
ncbi:hypothetical protein ACFQ0M_06780 [Kitasatospora aburaviensis]